MYISTNKIEYTTRFDYLYKHILYFQILRKRDLWVGLGCLSYVTQIISHCRKLKIITEHVHFKHFFQDEQKCSQADIGCSRA